MAEANGDPPDLAKVDSTKVESPEGVSSNVVPAAGLELPNMAQLNMEENLYDWESEDSDMEDPDMDNPESEYSEREDSDMDERCQPMTPPFSPHTLMIHLYRPHHEHNQRRLHLDLIPLDFMKSDLGRLRRHPLNVDHRKMVFPDLVTSEQVLPDILPTKLQNPCVPSTDATLPNMALVLMIGIPASGKSTLSKALCQQQPIPNTTIYLAQFDNCIPVAVQHELASGEMKQLRANMRTSLELLILHLCSIKKLDLSTLDKDLVPFHNFIESSLHREKTDLSNNYVFIVDDNFYYRSMRQEWRHLATKYCMGYLQVQMNCPLEEALKRNKSRDCPIRKKTISQMYQRMEPPDFPNHIILSSLTSLGSQIEEFGRALERTLKEPLMPPVDDSELRIASKTFNAHSPLHQCDKLLKRMAGDRIRLHVNYDHKTRILETRRAIMDKIRDGTIELPTDAKEGIEVGDFNPLEIFLSKVFDKELGYV